jgi:ACDE family multidrug resistance protein
LLMGVSDAKPAIGASATNFVRFVGGAVAPFLAGKLSEKVSVGAPLYMGAGVVAVGAVTLLFSRRLLNRGSAPATTAEWNADLLEMVEELEYV